MKLVEIPEEQFLAEANDIVKQCQDKGIPVRILGSLCGYIQNTARDSSAKEMYHSLGRISKESSLFTDLDLIAYGSQRGKIMDVFEKHLKLVPDRYFNMAHGHQRLIYEKKQAFGIDLFFDRLEYSHDIDFGDKPGKGRLELDYPTISLADFALEKLQIHQIARKDLIDMIILLRYHDVVDKFEKEKIDGQFIAKTLSEDWGFWYDAIENLRKIRELAASFAAEGKIADLDIINQHLDKLSSMVENHPKTKKWEAGKKIGTSKIWYREVGEFSL